MDVWKEEEGGERCDEIQAFITVSLLLSRISLKWNRIVSWCI